MLLKNWRVAVAGLCLLAGCPESDPADSELALNDAGGIPSQSGDAAAAQDSAVASGRDASVQPGQPGKSDAGQGHDAAVVVVPDTFDYELEEVALTSDLVIPKGKTVRVGKGVTFTAKSNLKIDVQGALLIEGTKEAPVSFVGGAGAHSAWSGIVVQEGATLNLSEAKISGAKFGIHALPGSSYTIDRVTIDTSFKSAVLQSDGTLSNCTFKAVALFPAVTEGVTLDDPNGSLTIMDASPSVSNCRFDGSGGLNDMVRIGGDASPVFDHVYVHSSHCGFHTSGGTNNSPRITNSVLENLAYGIMAFATQPIIEDSVFRTNSNDVGFCNGATAANVPKLRNNYYAPNGLKLDSGCDKIGTKDAAPAATANAAAGASGL